MPGNPLSIAMGLFLITAIAAASPQRSRDDWESVTGDVL